MMAEWEFFFVTLDCNSSYSPLSSVTLVAVVCIFLLRSDD